MRQMTIDLISVGRISSTYLKEGIETYRRYMHPRWTLREKEVKEARIPKNASPKDIEKVKREESDALLNATSPDAFIIALTPEGRMRDTLSFAKMIEDISDRGYKHIAFWIGGSHGISESHKKKAHMRMSLSKLTFPHQLTRLIISEQLFRALKILNNEPYQK